MTHDPETNATKTNLAEAGDTRAGDTQAGDKRAIDRGRPPWHARPVSDVIGDLDVVAEHGLSPGEVESRLRRHGANTLPEGKKRSALARLAAQFNNVLIYVLIAAGIVAGFLGEWVDTGVIAGVVIINAFIGFFQEGKAEQAIDAIRNMLSPEAVVTRSGERHTVAAETLVPGDIVHVRAGDKVAADLRIFVSQSLQVQESALTGESAAVDKIVDPVSPDAPLGDRISMLYSGTLATYGTGKGVVVATGVNTELGRISGLVSGHAAMTTPLLDQMAVFARWLTLAIIVLAGFTLGFGLLFRDYSTTEMFMAAVGVAVAAIPEGLPAIMTITLAIGVTRMARRNAIIRRLPAVETLGAVSVICSDKTGTLTRNELMVRSLVTPQGRYAVAGNGYSPDGDITPDGDEECGGDRPETAGRPDLLWAARVAALCNDAQIRRRDGDWVLNGNPTDGALIAFAAKAGLNPDALRKEMPAVSTIPFDSSHKFMATTHVLDDGRRFALVKGAPERLLEMCRFQGAPGGAPGGESGGESGGGHGGGGEPIDAGYWHSVMDDLAGDGQRLIGVAAKVMSDDEKLSANALATGLTWLGVLGLIDPARPDAVDAVATCRQAGITVKMITGDHAATAAAIAVDFGIIEPTAADRQQVLTGRDLDSMASADLADASNSINVFARTTPENKLQLVQALQAHGHVVAMTGDGVNDAPALKRADVGIAMGIKGTEAAKEASAMVLVDDNFASIARAVEEGRTVYDNLKKAILFILPTSFGQALVVLAAIMAGMTLPITPVQILWVNMITAVTLALTLAFEPPEADIMRRPPRSRNEPLWSGFLIWRIAFVSVLLLVGAFGLFAYQRMLGVELEVARTVAVGSLVFGQVVYLLNARRILASSLTVQGVFGSWICLAGIGAVMVFQALFTYAPFMHYLFHSGPMTLGQWGMVAAFGLALFLVVETEKAVIRLVLARRRRSSGKADA